MLHNDRLRFLSGWRLPGRRRRTRSRNRLCAITIEHDRLRFLVVLARQQYALRYDFSSIRRAVEKNWYDERHNDDEYDCADLKGSVRGKYAQRYA